LLMLPSRGPESKLDILRPLLRKLVPLNFSLYDISFFLPVESLCLSDFLVDIKLTFSFDIDFCLRVDVYGLNFLICVNETDAAARRLGRTLT
jgi:hypothetical protein